MFKKKKDINKTATPSPAQPQNQNAALSMECATELSSIFGGYAYNVDIKVSFKPDDFSEENSEIFETVKGIVMGAKTIIVQTYKKGGEGYQRMFVESENALINLRKLVAGGVLSGKAIMALGADIQQIDRALNAIRITDKGKRITRASFQPK